MTAPWMAAGFVHGVLNTDNMNLTGRELRLRPYRFLPKQRPRLHRRLFRLDRVSTPSAASPRRCSGTCSGSAAALSLIAPVDPLIEALNSYWPRLSRRPGRGHGAAARPEARRPEAEVALAEAGLRALAEGGEAQRWEPFFFDWFGGPASERARMAAPRARSMAALGLLAFRGALKGFESRPP